MANTSDFKIKIDGVELSPEDIIKQGVIIGDDFLDRNQFEKWFEDLFKRVGANNARLVKFANKLAKDTYVITEKLKNGNNKFTFIKDLEKLNQEFLAFTAGYQKGAGQLGGDISLLTVFGFGTDKEKMYFLEKESSLESNVVEEGKIKFKNSKTALQNLIDVAKVDLSIEKSFESHLTTFKKELETELDSSIRSNLHKWAWYNLEDRYEAFHKEDIDNEGVTLAGYFWGKGHLSGYATEAFTTHLGLFHPNFRKVGVGEGTVIGEFPNGYMDYHLYMILKATKGNTNSQLSGDSVIIDKNGKVIFNTQSKGSVNTSYNFTITYQEFLRNVKEFVDVFRNWNGKSQQEKKELLDILFQKFSTTAFVDIKQRIKDNLVEEVKKQI